VKELAEKHVSFEGGVEGEKHKEHPEYKQVQARFPRREEGGSEESGEDEEPV